MAKWNTSIELPADPTVALGAATKQYVDASLSFKPNLSGGTGVIVPFYQYPGNVYTNSAILELCDTIRRYPSVPFLVILNPSSGPGTTADGNYTGLISMLQGAGASILGYVATNYAATALATVEADIDTWTSLYPGINGIFVDQMTSADNTTNITYYQAVTTYAHNKGYFPVVGNPGSQVDSNYFLSETADIISYVEAQGYQSESTLQQAYVGGSGFNVPNAKKASIVYTVSYDPAQLALMRRWAKWIYITDAVSTNPYAVLPTYLETLTKDIAAPSFGPNISASDFFSDYLVAGGVTPTSANLTGVMTSPVRAYVSGMLTLVQAGAASLTFTYAASSDTYDDLTNQGEIVHVAVANGAAAPALTPYSLRLQKVVTSATAITSVTQLASTSVTIPQSITVGGALTSTGVELPVSGNVVLAGRHGLGAFQLADTNHQLTYNGNPSSAWVASTAVAVNTVWVPTALNGWCYRCVTAGTTGTAQPAWPTAPNAQVVDGTVTWEIEARAFAGQSIDGPALYGYSGGILGTTVDNVWAMKWASGGTVTFNGNLHVPNGSAIQTVLGGRLFSGPAGDTWGVAPADSAGSAFSICDYTGTSQWTWDFNQNLTTTKAISAGSITGTSIVATSGSFTKDGTHGFQIDGANNISFNSSILYNNSGFELGVGTHYWAFNTDGSASTPGALTVNGAITSGTGTGDQILYLNGGSSGTAGGSALFLQQGGSTGCAIGNYSAVIGSAYDARLVLYGSAGIVNYHATTFNSTINVAGAATFSGNVAVGSIANFPVNQATGPLVYESDATNHSLGIRTGPSTAYRYFTFDYLGNFNVPNGGITSGVITVNTGGSANSLIINDTGVNGANLSLRGNGANTPTKTMRAYDGNLEFVNNAYSAVIATLADSGQFTVSGALVANNVFAGINAFYIRPNGAGSSVGQAIIGGDGRLTVNGPAQATGYLGANNTAAPVAPLDVLAGTNGRLLVRGTNSGADTTVDFVNASNGAYAAATFTATSYNFTGGSISAPNYSTTDTGTADLNTILTPGFHRVEVSSANNPGFNYGQLIVSQGADTALQIGGDFGSSNLYFRGGNPPPIGNGSWGAWRTIWHDGNLNVAAYAGTFGSTGSSAGYTFYDRTSTAPSNWTWYATGGVANLYNVVSGNVLTVTGDGILSGPGISQAASNSTLVQRTVNGYIYANYFNTTANDISTTLAGSIAVQTNGDNFIRWQTRANLFATNNTTVGLPSAAGNANFYLGTGDGASLTTYDTGMKCQWGFGISDYTGTVRTVYDARAGIWYASDFSLTSDAAKKLNIRDLDYRGPLRPRSFTLVDGGKPSFGFVAQEVEALYPEAVAGADGEKSVSYSLLTAVLSHQVNALEARLTALERPGFLRRLWRAIW